VSRRVAGAATGVPREAAAAPPGGRAVGGWVWRGGRVGSAGRIFFKGNRYCVEQIGLGGRGYFGHFGIFLPLFFLKINIILSKVSRSKYANLKSVQLQIKD